VSIEREFDIVIVGGGPAGSSCALSLAGSGLRVAILDKEEFPRDKICGDALSADVVKQLSQLSEGLSEKFSHALAKTRSFGVRLYAPDLTCLDIPFIEKGMTTCGYICPRKAFDDFLFQEAKEHANLRVIENCKVEGISPLSGAVEISTSQGTIRACLVIGADGVNSVVGRVTGKRSVDRRHHSAGLRVYYENVFGFHENNHVELYFFKDILPGYLWVFPLPDNRANVGIGVLSSQVSRKKLNLNTELHKLLITHPLLRERFALARPLENSRGHGLPLGSLRRSISGDRFLLIGDAASLVDPFTGEGIGNAIRSGRVAAAHAISCFKEKKFSADFNFAYDREIYARMWRELRLSYALQRLCRYPWLFNHIIKKASKSQYWRQFLTDALADINTKVQFIDPRFYYRLLTK
jgi:geranylgeranyl reductase family protein